MQNMTMQMQPNIVSVNMINVGNELVGEHFEQMRLSMAGNGSLVSLDMRRNPGYDVGEYCSACTNP